MLQLKILFHSTVTDFRINPRFLTQNYFLITMLLLFLTFNDLSSFFIYIMIQLKQTLFHFKIIHGLSLVLQINLFMCSCWDIFLKPCQVQVIAQPTVSDTWLTLFTKYYYSHSFNYCSFYFSFFFYLYIFICPSLFLVFKGYKSHYSDLSVTFILIFYFFSKEKYRVWLRIL